MHLATWLAFAAAALIVLVIPGPTVLTVIGYALTHGRRAQLALVAAVALGDATALAFSMLGLGALLRTSALWFGIVRIAGGLYLLYLALRMFRAGLDDAPPPGCVAAVPLRHVFVRTWLVTALNPKGMVFFVAFLPQFVDPARAVGPQLWLLAGTFVLLAAVNAGLYALFAARTTHLLAGLRARRSLHFTGATLLSAAGFWSLLRRGSV